MERPVAQALGGAGGLAQSGCLHFISGLGFLSCFDKNRMLHVQTSWLPPSHTKHASAVCRGCTAQAAAACLANRVKLSQLSQPDCLPAPSLCWKRGKSPVKFSTRDPRSWRATSQGAVLLPSTCRHAQVFGPFLNNCSVKMDVPEFEGLQSRQEADAERGSEGHGLHVRTSWTSNAGGCNERGTGEKPGRTQSPPLPASAVCPRAVRQETGRDGPRVCPTTRPFLCSSAFAMPSWGFNGLISLPECFFTCLILSCYSRGNDPNTQRGFIAFPALSPSLFPIIPALKLAACVGGHQLFSTSIGQDLAGGRVCGMLLFCWTVSGAEREVRRVRTVRTSSDQ